MLCQVSKKGDETQLSLLYTALEARRVQEGSRGFKRVQEDSRASKKVEAKPQHIKKHSTYQHHSP